MKIYAYVQTKDGRPLMPVMKTGRVRKFLKSGKARIVSKVPLILRLTYDLGEEHTDMIITGIDPGRTNIGLCAIDSKGRILYVSDIETRNKYIAQFMLARKRARQASRKGIRQVRQRKARKFKTTMAMDAANRRMENKHVIWDRILPLCEKPVPLHDIRNKEARFYNRKRWKGWLTPTANQLLQTHQNALNKVLKILPVTDIVIELNKFSFARMENPEIHGQEFCNGPLKGFLSVND